MRPEWLLVAISVLYVATVHADRAKVPLSRSEFFDLETDMEWFLFKNGVDIGDDS